MVDEKREKTAEKLVVEAINIMQRGLPGKDLDDRGVVTELWGVFNSPAAREIYHRIERLRTSKG